MQLLRVKLLSIVPDMCKPITINLIIKRMTYRYHMSVGTVTISIRKIVERQNRYS
jgi:hypothetical protein